MQTWELLQFYGEDNCFSMFVFSFNMILFDHMKYWEAEALRISEFSYMRIYAQHLFQFKKYTQINTYFS